MRDGGPSGSRGEGALFEVKGSKPKGSRAISRLPQSHAHTKTDRLRLRERARARKRERARQTDRQTDRDRGGQTHTHTRIQTPPVGFNTRNVGVAEGVAHDLAAPIT